MSEDIDSFFEDAGRSWAELTGRKGSKIEVPEWGNDDGPATFYVKIVDGYKQTFFSKYSISSEPAKWAAAFLVATCHDIFDVPFFYKDKDELGKDLNEDEIEKQMQESFHKFMKKMNPNDYIKVATEAVKKISDKQGKTPEDVKNGSDQTEVVG